LPNTLPRHCVRAKLEQKIEERTRELEAQKSLLNNILTNSSNGISVTEMIRDESGNVVNARTILANDAAVNYIGLPREIFLSKTAVELDPNILSSDYGQICLNTLRTGEPALSQYYMEATGRWQETHHI
jgi:PAS domain-containing protein